MTIQTAIESAGQGDTIIVQSGTYKERIDFLGKALLVKSRFGPQYTRIDGMSSGTVVTFHAGEGPDSRLQGFLITNGLASWGGGVYCCNASPTLKDNIIRKNNAYNGGGIFLCQYSSPQIVGNYIEQNFSTSMGGGIFSVESTPHIEANIITGNTG
ncbi:MAG: DUF1565 domain-containing protein, partial [Planctomycetes bacterium]|nr:DUF1565 domain-containing protein [Planctomycetota bacterium]